MFRGIFSQRDWNYYYNKIDNAQRAYHGYAYDNEWNQRLMTQWEKSVAEAKCYLNRTTPQHCDSNASMTREQFLNEQIESIAQAKKRDYPEFANITGTTK